jgi:hypothetical protein
VYAPASCGGLMKKKTPDEKIREEKLSNTTIQSVHATDKKAQWDACPSQPEFERVCTKKMPPDVAMWRTPNCFRESLEGQASAASPPMLAMKGS